MDLRSTQGTIMHKMIVYFDPVDKVLYNDENNQASRAFFSGTGNRIVGEKTDSRIIFHIDVNSAFLSWSAVKRLQEDPDSVDLRTIPSVVGGDPTTRHGIVTAKSLPAKRYGIRTADTIASAMNRCPGLVVIPSDFTIYREYSHRFLEILRSYTGEVEQASIDEAYMDATTLCIKAVETEAGKTGSGRFPPQESPALDHPGPVSPVREAAIQLAASIREKIRTQLGFTVNVGISSNRLLAKMASDFEKPDRTHTLFPEEVPAKLWPLPIGDLYGCGKRTAERLRSLGIRTIGDAAHTPVRVLTDHLGDKAGKYIYNSSRGIGRATVISVREDAKSYSNEYTTSSDITADTYEAEYLPLLRHLCDKVAGRLQRDGVYGKTVFVTVKTDDFRRRSAQRRLTDPSNNAQILYQAAAVLSDKLLLGEKGLFTEGAGVRLVGAGVSDLDDGSFRQVSLFDLLEEDPAENRDEKNPEAEDPAENRDWKNPETEDPAEKQDGKDPEAEAPVVKGQSKDQESEDPDAVKSRERTVRLQAMEAAINRRYGTGTVYRGSVETGSSSEKRKQDSADI